MEEREIHPRDGSGRVDRDAIIEYSAAGTKSDGHGSPITATTTKKLRVINRSSGASRSLAAVRRRRRF